MDDRTLTTLLCTLLGQIPGFDWNPDGPYTGDQVAVFYAPMDTEPDRAVAVRVYGTTDQPHLGWRRAQLRFRGRPGAPDGADVLAGVAFTRLQGLSRVGGISGIRRDSMTPLGADKNGREERTDNYTIILDNQEATS